MSKDDDEIERALGDFFGRQFGKFGTAKKPKQPRPMPEERVFKTEGSWGDGLSYDIKWDVNGVSELDDDDDDADVVFLDGRESAVVEFNLPPGGTARQQVAKSSVPSVGKVAGPFDIFPEKPSWLAWAVDRPWCTKCRKWIPDLTITVGEPETIQHFSTVNGARVLDSVITNNEYILDVMCHREGYKISSQRGILSTTIGG